MQAAHSRGCNFSRIPTNRHSRKHDPPVESTKNCGKAPPEEGSARSRGRQKGICAKIEVAERLVLPRSEGNTMASPARSSRLDSPAPVPSSDDAVRRAEEELLDEVMVSVSASLEKMTPEEREKAVSAAERAVAHLR